MYTTLEALKGYLGIAATETNDDDLLSTLINSATDFINNRCGRQFMASTRTCYYGRGSLRGQLLILDNDLLSVTTLTNGDGTVITADDYLLWPRNITPYAAIRLKQNRVWSFRDSDSEIVVTGQWGYSITPPADIVQACTRLAAHLYRQKDASFFDATSTPEMGGLVIQRGIPPDVDQLVRMYRRRTV